MMQTLNASVETVVEQLALLSASTEKAIAEIRAMPKNVNRLSHREIARLPRAAQVAYRREISRAARQE